MSDLKMMVWYFLKLPCSRFCLYITINNLAMDIYWVTFLVHCSRSNWNLECWLLRREENWRTRRKTLEARTRTNYKIKQHVTPGLEIGPMPQWWKASALTIALSLLPYISKFCTWTISHCLLSDFNDQRFLGSVVAFVNVWFKDLDSWANIVEVFYIKLLNGPRVRTILEKFTRKNTAKYVVAKFLCSDPMALCSYFFSQRRWSSRTFSGVQEKSLSQADAWCLSASIPPQVLPWLLRRTQVHMRHLQALWPPW